MMKAIIFHEYGGIDKLKCEEVPTPNLQHGEVLVKVKAAAINHLDIWERMGGVPLPHISGSDISGEVVQKSNDTIGPKIGTKVVIFPVITCGRCEFCLSHQLDHCSQHKIIGFQINGGYAEYVKVPTFNLFPITSNLSFEEAAALPVAGSTAWHMLINKGKVNPTSTVLIHGSSSGVSVFAIQLSKIFGAKVIVTAGTNEKAKKALKLGADYTVNYKEKNVTEEVKRITHGKGVDIVLDHVGEATFNIGLESLRYGGKMISAGVTTGKDIKFNIQYLYRNDLSIDGSYISTKNEFFQVLKMAEEGRLKSIISKVFSLKDASKAQSEMEHSRHFGKLLLKM